MRTDNETAGKFSPPTCRAGSCLCRRSVPARRRRHRAADRQRQAFPASSGLRVAPARPAGRQPTARQAEDNGGHSAFVLSGNRIASNSLSWTIVRASRGLRMPGSAQAAAQPSWRQDRPDLLQRAPPPGGIRAALAWRRVADQHRWRTLAVSSTALSTAGRFPVRRKRPNRPAVDNAPRLLASTKRIPVQLQSPALPDEARVTTKPPL